MADAVRPGNVKKVVLAYSGGLDTSVILKWLQTTYRCEVVTFTADLGQGEELEPARHKAQLLGIKPDNIFIEDVREEFVRQSRALAVGAETPPPQPWLPSDLGIIYSVSATVELLAWWLPQRDVYGVEQVAGILDRLIMAPLAKR